MISNKILILLFVIISIFCLSSSDVSKHSQRFKSSSSIIKDKFKGMILLGAFGDSLGAPTEDFNSNGNSTPKENRTCELSIATNWYNDKYYPNCWKIWPSPELIMVPFIILIYYF
jgi:hypothetical protein